MKPPGFALRAFLKVAGGIAEGPTAFSKVSLDLLLWTCSQRFPGVVADTAVRKMGCLRRDSLKTSRTPRSKKVERGGEWWRTGGEGAAHTSVVAILIVCRFLLFGFLRVAGCFQ